MKHTIVAITTSPDVNEAFDARFKFLGTIWSLMAVSDRHRFWSMSALEKIFLPAYQHGTCAIFYNTLSEPVSYLVWARLTEEVVHRLCLSGTLDLHLSEWNEGQKLWIIDFSARREYLRSIMLEHVYEQFKFEESVCYLHHRRSGFVAKEVDAMGFSRLCQLIK